MQHYIVSSQNFIETVPHMEKIYHPDNVHSSTDCIECMACSDNVVRAGLTPKYQDVETLVSMLEYNMVPAESRNFEGFKMDNYTILYNPPVPDFAVDMIEVCNSPLTK